MVDIRLLDVECGMLLADEDQEVYMCLERSGDEFTSYCSADEENWFTCEPRKIQFQDLMMNWSDFV